VVHGDTVETDEGTEGDAMFQNIVRLG
jgi:hypothetical protein